MSRPLAWHVELRRQVGRRRTLWSYGLLLALPPILVLAFWIGSRDASGAPATGASRLVDLAQHGSANFTVFALFAASDFLFVVIAALFAGDSVPAEASWSSLRYLLAAPVPRARLLTSKLVVAIGCTVAAVLLYVGWSLIVGAVAYGRAGYTSTGGLALDWVDFGPRLALSVGFIAVTLLQIVGIAFLIGTRTDSPLAAAGGAVLATIVSSILQSIDALGDLRHALPMAYSRVWFQTLNTEIAWRDLQRGVLWSLLYFLVTVGAAYLLFRRKDVLS
ncbi:MAG: ABC transporter permease [Austwickia sp.]|nr:ABC transporter permease subunit [Austwickia sp.]MCO5307870.1 ABC transporter permease [Austwickia sp.]